MTITPDSRIEMVNVEGTIEMEIAAGAARKSVAMTYAFGLRQKDKIDWARVNKAILVRWSPRGLHWIKERAWAYLMGKREFGT
jgi:hypothetical protein